MHTSLSRQSSFDTKSSFARPRHGADADADLREESAPVRLHLGRPAPSMRTLSPQPALPVTPLGEYTVSVSSSSASHRAQSTSSQSSRHDSPVVSSPWGDHAQVDTKHVPGARASVTVQAPGRQASVGEIVRAAPRPARPAAGPADPFSARKKGVRQAIERLVNRACTGADRDVLCKAFDREVLRPLMRARPPAGQGALEPGMLAHVLGELAAASPLFQRKRPHEGIFDALAGALLKRLGGHHMREADSQQVYAFVAGLAQGPHAAHRIALTVRTLGQMRHALGDHLMSQPQQEGFVLALCQARDAWPAGQVEGDGRFALFAQTQLGGLLGPVQGRSARIDPLMDALVPAARRIERAADLVPLAQGLTGALMAGDTPAAQWSAVRQASALWLSRLAAQEQDTSQAMAAVCKGVTLQSREAKTDAALFGVLDAVAGLADELHPESLAAMATEVASCRPGPGMLRRWREAHAPGGHGTGLALERVFWAVASRAGHKPAVAADVEPALAPPTGMRFSLHDAAKDPRYPLPSRPLSMAGRPGLAPHEVSAAVAKLLAPASPFVHDTLVPGVEDAATLRVHGARLARALLNAVPAEPEAKALQCWAEGFARLMRRSGAFTDPSPAAFDAFCSAMAASPERTQDAAQALVKAVVRAGVADLENASWGDKPSVRQRLVGIVSECLRIASGQSDPFAARKAAWDAAKAGFMVWNLGGLRCQAQASAMLEQAWNAAGLGGVSVDPAASSRS